jgi:hypothetical protein
MNIRETARPIAAFALAAAVILGIPLPVHAASSTCLAPSNYFDGYAQSTYGVAYEGVRGDITARNSALCLTDSTLNNSTVVWTMIANAGPTGSGNGWAQSGYRRTYDKYGVLLGIKHFAQQWDGDFGHDATNYLQSGTVSLGSNNVYKSVWNSNCYCLNSWANNSLVLSSSWNPYSTWAFPFAVQSAGEAIYTANDMPGDATNQAVVSNLQGERVSDDTFEALSCGTLAYHNDHPSTWHLSALNPMCTGFSMWSS